MPPKSKAQARFMHGVASGSIKRPDLTPEEAEEYVSGYPTKGLPEKVKAKPDAMPPQRKRQMRRGRAKLEG